MGHSGAGSQVSDSPRTHSRDKESRVGHFSEIRVLRPEMLRHHIKGRLKNAHLRAKVFSVKRLFTSERQRIPPESVLIV